MTKIISKKPDTQPSTPFAGLEASMRGRRNRRSQRRSPSKVPGAEIYAEITKSLRKVEQNIHSARFDGRPDLVIETFINLDHLNFVAHETFFELHRETCEEVWTLFVKVRAFSDKLWKRDAKKIIEFTKQTAEITTHSSRHSADPDATRRQRYRNRLSKRRPPAKVPDTEIYDEIAKSLGNVSQNLLLGGFDGRPDLVTEAFKELNDLNRAACDAFMELHRKACDEVSALDTRVQAFRDKLWKRDPKK